MPYLWRLWMENKDIAHWGCSLSIVFGKQNGRHRSVGFGDDPEATLARAVRRQQPETVFQGVFIFAGILRGDVAPIACRVASQAVADGDGIEPAGGVGRKDYLAESEFRLKCLGHNSFLS